MIFRYGSVLRPAAQVLAAKGAWRKIVLVDYLRFARAARIGGKGPLQ